MYIYINLYTCAYTKYDKYKIIKNMCIYVDIYVCINIYTYTHTLIIHLQVKSIQYSKNRYMSNSSIILPFLCKLYHKIAS